MQVLIAVTVGIATGVISSVLVWYGLTHMFIPKVKLSSQLVRYTGIDGTPRCQIKYMNHGKRPCYNLSLTLRLGIRGATTANTTEWMRVMDVSRPEVGAGAGYRTSLYVDQIERIHAMRELLPHQLKEALGDGEDRVALSAIFDSGFEAVFVAHLSAVDSFSRATSVTTAEYHAADIVPGRFMKSSLDVDHTDLVASLDNMYLEDE